MTARAAALGALAAVVLGAGCGGDGDPAVRAATATATATPRAAAAPIRITSPPPAARIRARRVGDGARVAATIRLRGTAPPDATVLLSSECAARGCRDLARAGADGTWSAELRVAAPAERPLAAVAAEDGADARPAARIRVRLRAPALPADGAPADHGRAVAPSPAPRATPPARERPRTLVMIGDSLAQGTASYLAQQLDGWRVTQDAERGRPLAEGMRVLARTAPGAQPAVLAFSLFTNDDPRNVAALEAAVRESVRRATPGGCAIWATIVRPPLAGRSYRAVNARLEALAVDPALGGRLLIVPWAAAVASQPAWLAADGVHATPAGYRARARMYADAARSCGA